MTVTVRSSINYVPASTDSFAEFESSTIRARSNEIFVHGAVWNHDGSLEYSIRAERATAVFLHLYDEHGAFKQTIPLIKKTEDGVAAIWEGTCANTSARDLYTIELSHSSGSTLRCVDPWAWGLSSNRRYGDWSQGLTWLGAVSFPQLPPVQNRPHVERQALRIMEMHLRGWTADKASGVEYPGTFDGAIERLDYLKDLGVNAVEVMPLTEFDECRFNDFWGYNPVHFFGPMGRYASASHTENALIHPHEIIEEVRRFSDALHARGMLFIVDMVFNHTGEGNESGAPISLKALQPSSFIYSEGWHTNYSGCGNTLNGHSKPLATLFRAALRFWVEVLGADGFRLDLAAVLLKDEQGRDLEISSFFEQIAADPVLKDLLWIAEPWGPSVYRLGHFGYLESSNGLRFVEWNDQYRDSHQRFMAGDGTARTALAHHLMGSHGLFANGDQSLRYITCHDGLSLMDLVMHTTPHVADAEALEALHEQQWLNHLSLLIGISSGPIMLLMGDDVGASRGGDHNPWDKDSEINYFPWDLVEQKPERADFVRALMNWRASHPVFNSTDSVSQRAHWHGLQPNTPNWDDAGLPLVIELTGERHLLAAVNPHPWVHQWRLPAPPIGHRWQWVCNTGDPDLRIVPDESERHPHDSQDLVLVGERSVLILESMPLEQ